MASLCKYQGILTTKTAMTSLGNNIFLGSTDVYVVHHQPKYHNAIGDCPFAQVTVTKCHRLGGLNSTHSLSSSFGGWKFKIKMLTNILL